MERKTYTLTQIAQLLGKPRSTLSTWLETFEAYIPSVRIGRTIKYHDDAVEVFRKIHALRQEGKINEEILQTLFPAEKETKQEKEQDKEQEMEKQSPDTPSLLPADLKGKVFQEVLQTRSEVATGTEEQSGKQKTIAAEESFDAQVPANSIASGGAQELFHTTMANESPVPATSSEAKTLAHFDVPTVTELAATSTILLSETLSAVATKSEVPREDEVTPVQIALYELNEEVVVLRQSLEEVRTEIATSTHYLTQQIATLNEQIRSQQFAILSLQQAVDRARKEQRQSFWRRMFAWQ